jgi:hypothetical protein
LLPQPGQLRRLLSRVWHFSVIVENRHLGHRVSQDVSESSDPKVMTAPRQCVFLPAVLFAMVVSAPGQVQSIPVQSLVSVPVEVAQSLVPANSENGAQALLDFKDSDIKFSLRNLMDLLRDHQHEGWVLAAYPDPKTNRPLIGAGFSLDVQATDHPQRDPLNPHPFLEPSSAQLWQAAGLAPDRLQEILDRFNRNAAAWSKKTYRRKIIRHTLSPQLTDEEATQLLRISAIQAVYNARAYCRNFDQLTAPQQMALTQLVFQMGTNLEEFVEFRGAVNDLDSSRELPRLDGFIETDADHWRTVQQTLIDSQWARQFTVRASTVIAMFDPEYVRDPYAAQLRVAAVLRPPVQPRRRRPSTATLRNASYNKRPAARHGKKAAHSQIKRKLT